MLRVEAVKKLFDGFLAVNEADLVVEKEKLLLS